MQHSRLAPSGENGHVGAGGIWRVDTGKSRNVEESGEMSSVHEGDWLIPRTLPYPRATSIPEQLLYPRPILHLLLDSKPFPTWVPQEN